MNAQNSKPLAVPLLPLMLFVVLMSSGMGAGAADAEEELVWKIAFTSYRDGNYDIYVMNADGTNQTNLTANTPGYDSLTSWSPDGTQIAFTSYRDGNYDIYVMNADGTNQTNITPDTSWDDDSPKWSPDGKKILFLSDELGYYELFVMDSDGANRQRLTSSVAQEYGASWSPNGNKILFISTEDWDSGSIYVMDADGSSLELLLSSLGYLGGAQWSPNGQKIAYSDEIYDGENYTGDVWVMNKNGGNRKNLTESPLGISVYVPEWSPDGSQLAFEWAQGSPSYESDIWVMDASDGGNKKNLTASSGDDDVPQWSPDGTQILFESNRDGIWELYVMNSTNGYPQTRLTMNDSGFVYNPAWSPVKLPAPEPSSHLAMATAVMSLCWMAMRRRRDLSG